MYNIINNMITINDQLKIIGTTDLRNQIAQLASSKNLKVETIIITKRGKPVAVLEDYDNYQRNNEMIESFEDLVLGYMAKEREEKSTKADYITEKEMMKKVGLTK